MPRGGKGGERNYTEAMEAATPGPLATLRAECGDGFQAVLGTAEADDNYRFNSILGLHALRLMAGRFGDAGKLADTPEGKRFRFDMIFLVDAAGGLGFAPEAASFARGQGSDFGAMASPVLWARGTWEARRGDPAAAAAIAAVLAARADSSHTHVDSLFARVVAAHATLAAGDTAAAQAQLVALVPTAGLEGLAWSLWEPLGLERLTLAELLLAQGKYQEAIAAASYLDAPAPFSYLLYRPASLELRLRAARALRNGGLVREYRDRIAALGRPESHDPDDRDLELK